MDELIKSITAEPTPLLVGLLTVVLLALVVYALIPSRTEPKRPRAKSWTAEIPANAREVFFPAPPFLDCVYRIELTGVVSQGSGNRVRYADAFYYTDDAQNFTKGHDWLHFNGTALFKSETHSGFIEMDRYLHRYAFDLDGRTERLTLTLATPGWNGSLFAQVEVLPKGTKMNVDIRYAVRERAFSIQQHAEAKRAADASAARLAARIRSLRVASEPLRNWENPVFQKSYAETHRDELLRSRSAVEKEALAILGQHEIVDELRKQEPAILERHLGRLQSLLIAEQLDVEARKEKPPAPPPPPSRRLTIEEVRERMCRRIVVQGEDRRAIMTAINAEKQRQIDMLDTFSLSEDEREAQLRDIDDWAVGEMQRLAPGKEVGPTKTIG